MIKTDRIVRCLAVLIIFHISACGPDRREDPTYQLNNIVTDLHIKNQSTDRVFLYRMDQEFLYRYVCDRGSMLFSVFDRETCNSPAGRVPRSQFETALHDYHEVDLSRQGLLQPSQLEKGISQLLIQIMLNKTELSKIMAIVSQDLEASSDSASAAILSSLSESQEEFASIELMLIELHNQISTIYQVNDDGDLKQHLAILERERGILLEKLATLRETMEDLKSKYFEANTGVLSETHIQVITNQWAFYINRLAEARESYQKALELEVGYRQALLWLASESQVVINFTSGLVESPQYSSVDAERFVRFFNVVFEFLLGPGSKPGSLPSEWPGHTQVVAGTFSTCVLSSNRVRCWGKEDYHVADVPQLSNPILIGEFWNTPCAIDSEGVKCWGAKRHDEFQVPALKNPVAVASEGGTACAIHDEGLKCWGADHPYIDFEELKLISPVQVSIAGLHLCALGLEGVKCWGRNDRGQTDVPELKNPKQISSGHSFTCALDDEDVKCWGMKRGGQPQLKNPRQVSAGAWYVCALDDEGVKCWGDNDNGQTDVPTLYNPVSITAGSYHACAIHDEGLKCWGGSNSSGERTIPSDLFLD